MQVPKKLQKILELVRSGFNKYYRFSKQYRLTAIACVLLLCVSLFTHVITIFSNFKFNSKQKFVVAASKVIQKNVKVDIGSSGNVQPLTTIVVKSQIDGIIINAGFKEGELVRSGQLLFEIDPEPLQAAYDQARANLARDRAQLQNSCLQLKKYEKLHRNKFVSDLDYEQILTNFKESEAMVQASIAAVDAARVQLEFTKIYAPITGTVGQILIDPGNAIKASAGASLVSINQMNPINVLFTIPEEHLPELIKNINDLENLEVKLGNEEKIGKLIFLDNQVNSLNGMITLKAEFCNCDLAFWPGQFVNIVLTIKQLSNALVVPSRAVQEGQQGAYVYIAEKIKDNKNSYFAKVKRVLVKTGPITKDQIVVVDGLQFGQTVVTEGHGHLTDDDIVEIYTDRT